MAARAFEGRVDSFDGLYLIGQEWIIAKQR